MALPLSCPTRRLHQRGGGGFTSFIFQSQWIKEQRSPHLWGACPEPQFLHGNLRRNHSNLSLALVPALTASLDVVGIKRINGCPVSINPYSKRLIHVGS